MKNTLTACLLILLATACKKEEKIKANGELGVSALAVTTYYVNGSTGNNANAGTSLSTALKTIQAALDKTVDGAGATILVAAGTYSERLSFPHSGASAAEPITLTAYNGGNVILDGSAANSQNEMIRVLSRSHVRIAGITIANNTRNHAAGIYIRGKGTDVQVTSCKLYNIAFTPDSTLAPTDGANHTANPLVVIGDTLASYNEIYIGGNQIYSCNTGFSEALTVNGNIENFLIESNIVHHIKNIGIDVAGHYPWTGAPASVNYARNGNVKYNIVYNCVSPVATSAGIYIDGGTWINVEGNSSFRNGTGISVGCESDNGTTNGVNIRDNFVYNNINAGMVLGANNPTSNVTNASVTNNTLYKNYTVGGWGGEIHLQRSDALSIKNNIIESGNGVNMEVIALSGYLFTNLSMDYNRYYSVSGSPDNVYFDFSAVEGKAVYTSLAAFTTGTGLDAHSTYGIPGFVSTTTPDFHIASGSAAINAGDPAFVTGSGELDIDKQTRIINGRVDIGADETSF